MCIRHINFKIPENKERAMKSETFFFSSLVVIIIIIIFYLFIYLF